MYFLYWNTSVFRQQIQPLITTKPLCSILFHQTDVYLKQHRGKSLFTLRHIQLFFVWQSSEKLFLKNNGITEAQELTLTSLCFISWHLLSWLLSKFIFPLPWPWQEVYFDGRFHLYVVVLVGCLPSHSTPCLNTGKQMQFSYLWPFLIILRFILRCIYHIYIGALTLGESHWLSVPWYTTLCN